jgi:hypothetical protein
MPLSSGFQAYAASQSRTVNYAVELELDRCANTYASGLCQATDLGDGRRCSYTFGTCQDVLNFNRTTKSRFYTINDKPAPLISGVRALPYMTRFVDLPQDIDIDKGTTAPRKAKLEFMFDYSQGSEDADKTVRNTQSGGEYWHNLLAKNPNYVSRPLRIFRGFVGLDFRDWQKVAEMKLTGFTIGKDGTTLEALDILAVLEKNVLPWAVSDNNFIMSTDNTVTAWNAGSGLITDSQTTMYALEASELPPLSGWQGDLVIEIGTPEGFSDNATIGSASGREFCIVNNISGNQLTVDRGRYGTVPVQHSGICHFRHVYIAGTETEGSPSDDIEPTNPIDVMRRILRDGGIPDAQVNEASFIEAKLFYPDDTILRIISKPKKVKDLLAELRQNTGTVMFVNRDNEIEAKVLHPVLPNEIVSSIDETSNIIERSQNLEDDPAKRITRAVILWAPNVEDPGTDPNNFDRVGGDVDAQAESAQEYGDIIPAVFSDPWTSRDAGHYYVLSIATRLVARLRSGERRLTFQVELADEQIEVGDHLIIATRYDTGLGANLGVPTSKIYFVISKTYVKPNVVQYVALDTSYYRKYAFISPDSLTDDYTSASATDKLYAYFGNEEDNRVGSTFLEPGYLIF